MSQFLIGFFSFLVNKKMLREPVFGESPFLAKVRRLRLLVAQGFPGDAAEEGMTLDVAHASTSRAQPVARVKLEQLWSSKMFTGHSYR